MIRVRFRVKCMARVRLRVRFNVRVRDCFLVWIKGKYEEAKGRGWG
jgi:hypothetical protein